MTQLRNEVARPAPIAPGRRQGWPGAAVAAGLLGLLATAAAPDRVVALLTWGATASLLLAAAGWRRWVEPRVRTSTAAYVVPLGLAVSAATLLQRSDWVGWAGVAAAAAGVSWMALRERTVSGWIGLTSLLPVALITVAAAGVGTGGVADLAGPAWLLVAGLGLALGRSTISR